VNNSAQLKKYEVDVSCEIGRFEDVNSSFTVNQHLLGIGIEFSESIYSNMFILR
jgi:hypothetical protein